ncbi:hypothetical protein [Actinomadura sp. GTD37]|uniref:hypothetical protein n=1 Tax=Actinomadura sp. GTD37 TaxID=1778030 RepID=UPI0035C11F1C
MSRSLVTAALAGAVLLALPVTAHAAEGGVHAVSLPFLWPRAEIDDVAPDGAGGVWIGGGQGAYCVPWIDSCGLYSAGNPVVRRWTGSSWKEFPINGWTGNGLIGRVVSGGGQTWLGGGAYDSGYLDQLFVFDGTAFQKVDKPSASSVGMLSTGPGGTWVSQAVFPDGTQPRLLKREGSGWTARDLPDIRTVVDDVQGTGATDVWAVGSRPSESGTGPWRPVVARFDGTAWTWAPTPALPSGVTNIAEVLPLAPDDVWVAAADHVAHWDGDGWTVTASPGPVSDIAVDGSGTLWAATPYGAEGRLYRLSGGAWQAVAVPAGTALTDITATGASTIWGVGRANDAPAAVSNS